MGKRIELDGNVYHVEKIHAQKNSPKGTYRICIDRGEPEIYESALQQRKLSMGPELEYVRTIKNVSSARKAVTMHLLIECYEYLIDNDNDTSEMPEYLQKRLGQLDDEIKAIKQYKKDEEFKRKMDIKYRGAS